MKVSAIIPAAGQGRRMGASIPKQFLLLKGKPILHYTLQAFRQCAVVSSVTLVVPPKDVETVRNEWRGLSDFVQRIVAGGEQRQDSVFNGLKAIDEDTEIVIIHDGVRPFVTQEMIRESVEAALEHGGAVVGVPLGDTIKRLGEDRFVERTVDRDSLWAMQTPQTFRYDLLREAFEKAYGESFYGTDEASLLERLGRKVKIIPGSPLNIKITRKEDLILSEGILSHQLKAAPVEL